MKAMNEGLKAKIYTKAGLTREIERFMGGKQGDKLMVTMFAKMMDNMAEDLEMDSGLGVKIGEQTISSLLYMDDANTFAEGYKQQAETLKAAEEFAVKTRFLGGGGSALEIGHIP